MSRVRSSGFHLVDLEYFAMKGARFSCNRDPMTPDIECNSYTGRAQADFNLRILEVFYWDNQVHTEGVAAKVETVGWHWELGLHITDQIDIFHEHHSRHRMDDTTPIDFNKDGKPDKFPVEDSYGIKFIFYMNPEPHRSLFK